MKVIANTPQERAKAIKELDGIIYTGKNEDGEEVFIIVEQNKDMIVKTRHKSKPKWLECVEYDEDGFQVSVSYEPY